MRVSVVICEHTLDRYDDFQEAADSVLEQTHEDVELVLVADGNDAVCERLREDYGDREDVILHCNDENVGLLQSRNNGAAVATGDIVAFMDDDAVPARDWAARLVDVYEKHDVPAAGGRMTADWVAGKPAFLPEEFYWLVGVTQRGFADCPGEVRNTFGSNISFEREVFEDLGGFATEMVGRKGDANLQGGETELCARLNAEYGRGVYYDPEATVAHKIYAYRTDPLWLLDRAFWQGYSKRRMATMMPDSGAEESEFLLRLLTEFAPDRATKLVRDFSLERLLQFVMLFVFTGFVGAGYLYAILRKELLS